MTVNSAGTHNMTSDFCGSNALKTNDVFLLGEK